MKKSILLLLVSLFASSGCGIVSTATSSVDLVKKPEMAYVLARYNGDANLEWSHWSNFDKASIKMIGSNAYKIYAVEPGRYAITDFYAAAGNYSISLKSSAKNQNADLRRNGQTLLGSFEAEAGQVTYIGDLQFSSFSTSLRVSDNFEYALNFMAEKYPEISRDKIVKSITEKGVHFQ